jgi:DNA mismatch repair protein MutL
MSRIRILPEGVISQIAAGEVVDRPASVVRELLDNSIDAGAGRISVRLESGGKRLIRVQDDGAGMERDDLLLAIERHATSKIASIEDLTAIHTLGFRGEALPSIGAVSRLEIVSRPGSQIVGHRLKMAGGRLLSIAETGAPPGTRVEVADLFFNVPARRKFLKGSKTEDEAVADVFCRIALPHTGVHFSMDDGERSPLDLAACPSVRSRLVDIMGREAAEAAIETKVEEEGVILKSFVAPSSLTRSRADQMFFYVNKRSIRDRFLMRAVMEGYGQRLMKGRFPYVVVFLEVDPEALDVNIHPAKQEVRFRDGREIFTIIVRTIDQALARPASHVLAPWKEAPASPAPPPRPRLAVAEQRAPYTEADQRSFLEPLPDEPEPRGLHYRPEVIGQLGDTYILCQVEDGLLLVDQHAAHERVLYETLKGRFEASGIESQGLLVPYRLEVPQRDTKRMLDHQEALARLGIEIEPFGGNTFLLRTVPAFLEKAEWGRFLQDLLPELEKGEKVGQPVSEGALSVMACHGAVRAGQRLTREEMERLLEQLGDAVLPGHCPHGRPVVVRLRYHDLEKMFKR